MSALKQLQIRRNLAELREIALDKKVTQTTPTQPLPTPPVEVQPNSKATPPLPNETKQPKSKPPFDSLLNNSSPQPI